MQYIAIQNGHLPDTKNKHNSRGLITKGDTVEWDGSPRGFLKPIDEPDAPSEDMNRAEIITELKERGVQFFKGARTEQLQAILFTAKEIVQ